MPNYRRARMPGGTYFFTVNLLQRRQSDLLVRHIDTLRVVVRAVRKRHPFTIHGWVVLPDHIHCIFSLPPGDSDFSLRWRLIKGNFSKVLPRLEWQSPSRQKRGERGIWQICQVTKIETVLVQYAIAPYGALHRLVEQGVYNKDWAESSAADTLGYED